MVRPLLDLRKCLPYLSALPQTGRHDFFKLLVLVLGFGSKSFGCSRGVHAYLREKDQFTSRGVRCAFTLRLGARQTHLIIRGTGIVPGLCKLTGRAQVPIYFDSAFALLTAPSQALCGHWLGGLAQVHGPFSTDYLEVEAALVLFLLVIFSGNCSLRTSIGPYFITRIGRA